MTNILSHKVPRYVLSDFADLKLIEQGGEGIISIGKLDDFGQIALKQFMCSLDKCKKEIEILIEHRHPNIINLFGILWNGADNSVYLGYVMEYVEEGSLHDVIHIKTKPYDFPQICKWTGQIARGLQFLHRHGIIHRDIKPKNILVAGNLLKLADFGVAKSHDDITTAGAGTFVYMAPEVIKGKSKLSSDIYSLGITIWEVFHRKPPYYELENTGGYSLINKIVEGARPAIESGKMDRDMVEFLQRCWKDNPEQRPPISEVVGYFERKIGQIDTFSNQIDTLGTLHDSRSPKTLTVFDADKLQKHENTILILGGVKNGTRDVEILVLSPDRSKWIQSLLQLSEDASGHGAIYLNEEIYLIGGDENPKRLCKLDKNLKWINLADMNVGRKFITNSCLKWNGYIWIFGGWDGKALKSVERYDPKENKWTLMPDMKQARFWAAAVLWNDRIIITGGQQFLNTQLNTIECFKDGSWTSLANLPNPLFDHSLVLYKNQLLVIGGWDLESDQRPCSNVWGIDPNELTGSTKAKWKQLLPMTTQGCLFSGILLNDEIYVIGGNTGIRSPSRDRVEIFNGEKWRNGPSLPHALYAMPAVIIPQTLADRLCNYRH